MMKVRWHLWMTIPFMLAVFILSLTPIVSRDALIHHMALPKLWLEHGIWSVDTFRTYAFYPANLQLLYYLSILLNLEFLPKIIHFSFLLMTSLLIYRYLRQNQINPYLSSLAVILTLTIPINQRLASEVYVDLGLLFFSSLSLLSFLNWKNANFERATPLYVSAAAAGLAVGTKYNGLVPFMVIGCFVMFASARHSRSNAKALGYGLQFCSIALLLTLPWWVRNYIASGGNPFYPLFTSILPDQLDVVSPLYPVVKSTMVYRALAGESLLDMLLIPARIFFDGEDHNFLRYDGKLNPMMLILLPFLWLTIRQESRRLASFQPVSGRTVKTQLSDQKYLFCFFLLTLLISLKGAIRIRYVIPIITPVIILNIFCLDYFFNTAKQYKKYIGLACILFYLSYNMVYTYNLYTQLGVYDFLSGKETKRDYLNRHLRFYQIYDYINAKTPLDAVIYDVMSGHRSYYVDREYIHDRRHVDTIFFNYTKEQRAPAAYADYLHTLETRHGQGATHLIINPYQFIETYRRIFPTPDKTQNTQLPRELMNFVTFLNRQKPLFQSHNTILYELRPSS